MSKNSTKCNASREILLLMCLITLTQNIYNLKFRDWMNETQNKSTSFAKRFISWDLATKTDNLGMSVRIKKNCDTRVTQKITKLHALCCSGLCACTGCMLMCLLKLFFVHYFIFCFHYTVIILSFIYIQAYLYRAVLIIKENR